LNKNGLSSLISVRNLEFSYPKKEILKGVSFEIKNGESLSILGENGCGKSTLLKCMLNLLKFRGEILLNGVNLHKISRANLAKKIAYIPQFPNVTFEYEAIDVVLMSRLAHKGFFENYSKKDYEICYVSMERLGISHLANRVFKSLSGGERQLVCIARALSSGAKAIFMDEPVSGLDFGNQIKLLNLIKELSGEGYTIVITTHHPRHAKFLNSTILMLKNGVKFRHGSAELLDTKNISELYEVDYEKYKEIL